MLSFSLDYFLQVFFPLCFSSLLFLCVECTLDTFKNIINLCHLYFKNNLVIAASSA